MAKVLVISTSNELYALQPQNIVYISSDGSYSIFTLIDGTKITFSFNLQHSGELIVSQLGGEAQRFLRIGKSLIVNRDYIYHIIPAKQQLVLADPDMQRRFDLTASKEALRQVKQLIESQL